MSHPRRILFQVLGIGVSFIALTLLPPTILAENEGGNFFRQSPLLLRAAPTFRNPHVLAHYQFTIQLPLGAVLPLKSVKIVQQPNLERLIFYQKGTYAFLEDSLNGGEPVPLEAVEIGPSHSQGVTVSLVKPLPPGKTFTIALRGRNPLRGGIYQFGVTAFPVGQNSQGLYLGVGRLHFSMPGGGR